MKKVAEAREKWKKIRVRKIKDQRRGIKPSPEAGAQSQLVSIAKFLELIPVLSLSRLSLSRRRTKSGEGGTSGGQAVRSGDLEGLYMSTNSPLLLKLYNSTDLTLVFCALTSLGFLGVWLEFGRDLTTLGLQSEYELAQALTRNKKKRHGFGFEMKCWSLPKNIYELV